MEELLKKKKAKERAKREKERTKYEAKKDSVVNELFSEGQRLSNELAAFKEKVHMHMNDMHDALKNYGEIKKTSKGGFTLANKDKSKQIKRTRDTKPTWDERADKGIALIKEFLYDTVKKRDLKIFEILISFLEKNSAGDLEYKRVMQLLHHEDKYEDNRWKEGLKLLKESHQNILQAYGYYFISQNAEQKQHLQLNFSAI